MRESRPEPHAPVLREGLALLREYNKAYRTEHRIFERTLSGTRFGNCGLQLVFKAV